jgi:hypothetical protein
METKMVKAPSEKEVKKEEEKIRKIYDCYRYLLANAQDEGLRKKITELAREHVLSKVNEATYSVELPLRNRLHELEDELKRAKEKEKKS